MQQIWLSACLYQTRTCIADFCSLVEVRHLALSIQLYPTNNILCTFSVFDAIGKPASGILLGNLNWWGSYDLCMELKTVGLLPCKTSGLVPLSVS